MGAWKPRDQAGRAKNDGEIEAKSIRFFNFSASGADGLYFGRPAGARRLQKAGFVAPEAPQDSAKRPKGRPQCVKRAAKEVPGRQKWRQRGSRRGF